MKVFKRYLRWLIFAAVVFPMFFCGTGDTVAADLVQSPDEVSMGIVHRHGDEICTKQVWIPCGGSWHDDHHGSHRIHYCTYQKSDKVVNGHKLSEIHSGEWYWGYATEEHHDGGYVTEVDCGLSTMGNFVIQRTEDDDGIHLTAYATVTNENLSNYTISWDDGTTGDVNSPVTIDVEERRTYTATIEWHDVKRDADFTDSLSYTDISYPCRCEFVSDGHVDAEMQIRCGEKPDDMVVPEKRGYIFDGYYKDDIQWIDQDGNPTAYFKIEHSDFDLSLSAKWSAKTYELKIGDSVYTFVYDEPYDDIDVSVLDLEKQGYGFGGISFDGEKIFNEYGKAVGNGIWKWDLPDNAVADIIWEELPDEEDRDRHHHDHEEEKVAVEPEPSVSSIPTVSEDRNEVVVSSDEAVILQDNDDDNGNDPEISDFNIEINRADDPGEAVAIESPDLDEPYIKLFCVANDDIPAGKNMDADENELQSDRREDNKLSPSVWIKRVMVVAAVTCGVVGGGTAAVYAVYAGFVYLFGMASVLNVLPDGRKKNLGKLTVVDRSGGDIEVSIPQDFVDNCSTGNIEIILPEMFVKKRDRKQLVVIVNEKKYLKNIKKNVELKVYS